ncbi:MAG: phage portal protein [Alphaproteobacteria bacterium]|nr:phage portal protein [Alphaproteobacteria bacterium]MDE2339922.1 phage portal protein [Alphaproteobacteria bacterium]
MGRFVTAPIPKGARPALMTGMGTIYPYGEWPNSYYAQVREAYLHNAVAQRAVRLVAEGVAALKIETCADNADALALVKATTAGQHLLENAAMYLLLHGNAFIQVLTDAAGDPVELFALRPERMGVELDARGWIRNYKYTLNGQTAPLRRHDAQGRTLLIHIKTAHPVDDHFGLGALGAAMGAIASHNAAAKWNKHLLDNMARPSGALVYEPGEAGATLSEEQFNRLRTEIDSHFSGPSNAARPLLLEGGLKWQALSLSPADMDFNNLKAAAAREIALAFGVPPVLLGLPGDATYSNYREASRALYRSTILPMANKLLHAIAEGLEGWWPEVKFRVDVDDLSALADDREKLWASVSAATFLTPDEKRAMLGLGPGSDELTENLEEQN